MGTFGAGEEKEKEASPSVMEVEEKDGKKRRPELAVTAEEDEKKAGGKTKTWRMSQQQIDLILSWDLSSDYVPRYIDQIDTMPDWSDERKETHRSMRLDAAAHINELRSKRRGLQQWVKAQLDKYGYVDVEEDEEGNKVN